MAPVALCRWPLRPSAPRADPWLPLRTVLPPDIDAIIKKGERDTADLNQKMQQFTENAMRFTMDGGMAYDYKVTAAGTRLCGLQAPSARLTPLLLPALCAEASLALACGRRTRRTSGATSAT